MVKLKIKQKIALILGVPNGTLVNQVIMFCYEIIRYLISATLSMSQRNFKINILLKYFNVSVIFFILGYSPLVSQTISGYYINQKNESFYIKDDTISFIILKDTVFTSYSIFHGKYSLKNNIIKTKNNKVEFYKIQQYKSKDTLCRMCFEDDNKEKLSYRVVSFEKSNFLETSKYYSDSIGCIYLKTKFKGNLTRYSFKSNIQLFDVSSVLNFEININSLNDHYISIFSDLSIDNSINNFKFKILNINSEAIEIFNFENCRKTILFKSADFRKSIFKK